MLNLVIFKTLCVILAGVCDRIRGGWKGPGDVLAGVRKLPVLFPGLVFMFLSLAVLPASAWVFAPIAGVIGGLLAWRQDNGWRGQFVFGNEGYDPTDLHRWYEPVRFGAIQGLVLLPLAIFYAPFAYFIHAAILGQILAMYVSEKLFKTHIEDGRIMDLKNAWPASELLGPIFTGLFWIAIVTFAGVF